MHEIKDPHVLGIAKYLLETHKCIHGFGFNGHFISLIPTGKYLYLSYRHKNNPNEHRLFKFLEKRGGGYTEVEAKKVLTTIRKEYGHDHHNPEFNDDYQEVIDYLVNNSIMGIVITGTEAG